MKKLYTKVALRDKSSIKLLLFITLVISTTFFSYGQVVFSPRTSDATPTREVYSVKGDFSMIGNTNLTLVNYSNTADNDDDMQFVDVDGIASTFNSSSASLTFSDENGAKQQCSNILYAGLYWVGRADTGADPNLDGDNNPNTFNVTKDGVTKSFDKRNVSIKGEGETTYTTFTATPTNINYPTNGTNRNIFVGYVEVTDFVRARGTGEYTVADISLVEGNADVTGYSGGWGMVVVYENSQMNWRDITVFDGYAYVGAGGPANTISASGFQAVQNGAVNVKLGIMASEGEVGWTGDFFQIERRNTGVFEPLSHSTNTPTNFFNSSILTDNDGDGNNDPRNPQIQNNTGVDIVTFNIDNGNDNAITIDDNELINNNQTSTTFRYGTVNDSYVIFNVTFAVDAYVPESTGVLTNTNISSGGSTLEPGDNSDYTIDIVNTGTEEINNTVITIPIPDTVNSTDLNITHTVNPAYASTVSDSAPVIVPPTAGNNGFIVWNLGTLPIPNNPAHIIATIGFRLTVTTDCSMLNDPLFNPVVSLEGTISGTGATSGIDFNEDLIQGYQTTGPCRGEPIPVPNNIPIDYLDYINEPPTASDPSPINIECIADLPVPDVEVVTDEADNSGIPPIVAFVSDSSDNNCPETITRTYSVTDDCNNSINVQQTITISSATAPVVPANDASTVECLASATQPTAPVVNDVCGNVITPVITENADPTCEGDKIYTFTYTDCAGNSSVYTYTYTIDVVTAPVVPANDSSTVECLASATQPTAPVVNDVCGNAITPVITENTDPTCEGDKIYTFTYTDCAGNSSVYTYTYTIDVVTAPVVPANDSSTVECLADATQPTAPVVNDVCGNAITPVITENADPTCEGDKIYTFTYTDCAGNSSVYTYTYTIDVVTAPVVPANDSSTVECLASATQPTAPVVNDVCGNAITPVITENADPTCEGDKIYTFTYTDCAGNSSVYTYTYTIDLLAFTLPANGVQTVDNLAEATTPTPPTVNDNCGNEITPTGPTVSATPACQGAIVYTYTYTDCAGNTADWTYTYTIELAPFTVPADDSSTVECIANATTPTPPTVFDANGDEIVPVMTENVDPTCEGDKIYTFTYTDCAGNTEDWVYTYTIDVVTAPVVPTNDSSTVECLADATQPTAPVVNDVCGNAITPVITENADPTCEGDKIYTFTYTDCAGNSSVYTYTYTIDVVTAPVVPANDSSTVECLADATQPTAPVVNDVCGNAITPVITENADPTCEGDKIYTFTYTDCAGNSSVYTYTYTIDVVTAPVVPANDGSTVECLASATQPTAPVVNDVCGNAITPVITENADPTCEGDKIYTFTYTDCAGNSSVYTYTYTIDLLAFTLPANGVQTVDNLAEATTPTPPTVNDNCGNEITPTGPTVSATPACQGAIVYTYTYTDCAGNTADWTYTYTIELAPFTVPADDSSTVECIANATTPTPPTVFDANGDEIVPVMTENVDPTCEGDKIYTFTYTDCAGNTEDWVYTYTIDVVTAPVVPTNDSSTVECLADATQPTAPVVNDVCGNAITPVITENADPTCEGDKIYTFTYTDCAGNSSVYTYTYTIDVVTAPVVPANDSSTVECLADATQPTAPVVNDVCGNAITPVITENADPTCEGDKIYTFTYTDCAGNSSVYTYTYTIDVVTAPVVPANDSSTVECLADATQPTAPVVNDVCGNAITPVITENADPTCEGDKIYTFTYTDCAGNSSVYTYTYTIDLLAFTLPANGVQTVDNLAEATTPTPPTVNDNCGNEITPTGPTVSATPACQGAIVYTYTYTDCAGNTADWTYTYTIELAPFTVPADDSSTVECIANATTPTPPTVFDANGDEIVPVMTENVDPTCEGDKIYTFTYTDCAGNTEDWVYTYTIDVVTAPVVPTNDSSTVECLADATQPTAPVVNDVCGNAITPVITENADPTCEGDKIYTFTYTDCAGNSSVYTYTYTIDVVTAPVVPANDSSTVECLADATQPTAPVVNDVCGNAITPVITENADPTCEGDKIYTFTYTDCAGNSSVYTYTYTIDVVTAPVVPANDSSTVECLADATQPTAPVVNDVCGNAITPVITENADPTCEGDKIYTFTYTDCAGNNSVYTYTYTVKDTTPPVLSLPNNVSAECSDDLTPISFGTATATDNCDPNPIISFNDVRTDDACEGTYTITRTWTATDACGNITTANQIISTSDTTAPEFDQTTLPGDVVVECDNVPLADTLTASDNCGNAIVTVEDIRTDGNCDYNYTITRTYTATDDCGLTNTHVQTITVQDTTPPTFVETLPATSLVVECDAIPTAQVLTATDSCGAATVSVSDTRTDGTCPNSYTLARTWTATDECGLTTTHTQIITVQDTTPPTFDQTPPRNTTVECDAIPDVTNITASDNCGSATVTVNDVITNGDCPSNYFIARTWIATDECGLTTSHTQIITVQDTTAPVPTSTYEETLDVSCIDIPEAPELEFEDNCSSNITVVFNETNSFDENVFEDYQIIRTWTVRDECNNEEVYTQILNVTLDEIYSEIVAEDRCFDEGIFNLNNLISDTLNTNGTWELLEGNPDATLNGSIFDPTVLELSEDFLPDDGGIDYRFRYTTTDQGCISITEVIMNIHADCVVLPCGENDIEISTAITPNGDGFNESFDIEGIDLCGFVAEVKIFNRWGALVYESNNYTLGSIKTSGAKGDWDGTPNTSIGNAGKLPNGTYYYIIKLQNSGLSPLTGPIYLGTK
ncbi:gliding motility-associated C-terminal domain-containing protein [Flaviramulus sp. BrNp1-15]|uniref:gliding motility-associated C-terminal domain-containing protein n=1 Tax=Flaviramulus sp. BrNp1-15 TaxID=2916754 RepID=UPI001EE8565A|nr:gliding motility-associated C-terminal domain-containing protein [Flaviramulus sp. BrNp1-15]ULC58109.1 gliding motility-associated C-terminal domain-containing protein [Flaviramulus sp. BrNp1-15]